jgi:predicted PurR-regulated permease PerM
MKAWMNAQSLFTFPVPFLHQAVLRTPPVVAIAKAEDAIFTLNWLSASGTALLLTVAVAAGLAAAGIPAVSLLACVTMILCLAQIGPLPILAPAVAYLAMNDRYGAAGLIAALTVALSVVDGLLRPYLIGREIKMPMMLVFAGVVGGLLAFGMLGLFIGPMALAMGRNGATPQARACEAASV